MEISLLKAVLNSITAFLHSSPGDDDAGPFEMYFQKIEEMLKLLKPALDAIVDSDIVSYNLLTKAFKELGQSIDELRDLFATLHPLKSKICFMIQTDELISKLRASGLRFFKLLESLQSSLPDELSSGSLEHCIQKITHMGYEQSSTIIKEALKKQAEGEGPSSETLVKVEVCLNLKTNQTLLIEAVALEHLKENAEQAESIEEVEYIDQMIALVTLMHDRYIAVKHSQSSSPVSIPPDFCCPLSLELMTDPVIVASGQTYERAYIKNWIDLGLTVCPKTRQTLAHTNLIPNYTVKELIVNWCETNNVKMPDHVTTLLPVHFSPLHPHVDTGVARGNQPLSPESIRSTGSEADGFVSSGANHMQGSSPIHPRSAPKGSFSGMTVNMNGLEIGRLSKVSSEGRVVNSEQCNTISIGQLSLSPPRRDNSNSILGAGQFSHDDNRSASESSAHSSEFPRGISGDVNETAQELGRSSAYNSDASGEMAAEPPAASTMATQQREPDYPARTETRPRNQTFWRRPSERFVPRIVPSSPAENRPDLLEIETQVRKLVEDLESDSLDDQREATAQLRLLARNNMDNRIVIANCGAISLLVRLLRSTDTRTQENAVTALLNLSINDNNKAAIANADAIDPLIHVLETGSSMAKENSAATLFSLSVMEENKIKIGISGAVRPLVDLLGNGTPRGKRDAATALFNLSIFHENKARIAEAGAVRYLVELMDPAAGMVDKAAAVLANLATIHEGRTEIGQEGGIRGLVEVVELGSAKGKENAAAALLQLCTNSSRYCSMVLQEGAVPPLVALSQSGTPRAKEKAQALLSYFRNNRHGGAGRA